MNAESGAADHIDIRTGTGSSPEPFDVPVALFLFRRSATVLRILEVLSVVQPRTLYLIGDGPRTQAEEHEVLTARREIEAAIGWPCDVIRNYAPENRGVYANIAGGAMWVLERESRAIFLEDDNLPEVSFFSFCREMLDRYEDDGRVMWVCGTNYLEDYSSPDGSSYVFTKHLMPCGWASWASKFPRLYDGDMQILEDPIALRRLRYEYTSQALYRQQVNSARSERHRRETGKPYASWDFQMALSIREGSVYGICPCKNQIVNIGVDDLSTHGGVSLANTMTQRFCGIDSLSLDEPLHHPRFILSDLRFERALDRVILIPLRARLKERAAAVVKWVFGINRYDRFKMANSRFFGRLS
ncbi:MAG: glycosyltransferase family 2 protein [Coriobacteriia bacterium]